MKKKEKKENLESSNMSRKIILSIFGIMLALIGMLMYASMFLFSQAAVIITAGCLAYVLIVAFLSFKLKLDKYRQGEKESVMLILLLAIFMLIWDYYAWWILGVMVALLALASTRLVIWLWFTLTEKRAKEEYGMGS